MAYNPNEIPWLADECDVLGYPLLADECDVLGYPLFPGTVKSNIIPMDGQYYMSIELAEANIIDRYRADRAVAAAVVHLTKIWLADLHDAEITEVTPRPRDPATPRPRPRPRKIYHPFL